MGNPLRTTIASAKATAKALGYSLNKTTSGEYRVAPLTGTPAEKEAKAAYETDIDAALATARAMASGEYGIKG